METATNLSIRWREDIASLDRRIELWESGQMTARLNGEDVTALQAPLLRQQLVDLKLALKILERRIGV